MANHGELVDWVNWLIEFISRSAKLQTSAQRVSQ